MLAGLGEFLELDPELVDDLKTALSEACNNVVIHAYPGRTGPLLVSLDISPDGLDVVVRDEGVGIRRVSAAESRMGVGLAVMMALTNRAEFRSTPDGGTEVQLSFGADGAASRLAELPASGDPTQGRPLGLAGDIVGTISPVELLPEVMGRLVRAVAAGAHFAVDRFQGLHELTSAIGELACERRVAGGVGFSIVGRPKRLELYVGPLPDGSHDLLFDGSDPSVALEPLIDELVTSELPSGELLRAVVVEPRG